MAKLCNPAGWHGLDAGAARAGVRLRRQELGIGVVFILLIYVACYSLSISPLFWLMSAEVFPNRLRGAGASAATVANWSANLLITVTFLSLITAVGKSWTFWIYAIFAALAILFVWRFVPETRGRRPLGSIDKYWTRGRRWPSPDTQEDGAA
jgi:MFS transporter, SP family, galactose:H+ symporter